MTPLGVKTGFLQELKAWMYLIGATGLNEGLISITSTNPVYTGSGRAFSGFGI